MTTKRSGEWIICTKCAGEGCHSQHLGSFTASEWDEAGHEFQEDYMRGTYDKQCERCRGSGKLWVDTGPCIAGQIAEGELAGYEVCPCAQCAGQRAQWRRDEARMQWIESGCPDGEFYYEG